MNKTISISKKLKRELDDLRRFDSETIENVIEDLLDERKAAGYAFLREIDAARKQIKYGQSYTIDEVQDKKKQVNPDRTTGKSTFAKNTKKQLRSLDKKTQKQLIEMIKMVQLLPYEYCQKVLCSDFFRLRTLNTIVFLDITKDKELEILRIGNRNKVYEVRIQNWAKLKNLRNKINI